MLNEKIYNILRRKSLILFHAKIREREVRIGRKLAPEKEMSAPKKGKSTVELPKEQTLE